MLSFLKLSSGMREADHLTSHSIEFNTLVTRYAALADFLLGLDP
jgi:hypothetical protein